MIVSGERVHTEPVACNGLLVIGDPHVSSRRPGRRKDEDWPGPILRKLERCVAIANERGLAPVLLGDLFERAVEPDEALKARLVRILKGFRIRPLTNVGNHDIAHTTLSDGDSLAVLGHADVLDVVAGNGAVGVYRMGEHRLGIGMTPFGQEIPRDLAGVLSGIDRLAWFTHHDIAFEGAYPGAVPPFPVAGADLVVNGHVHKTKPSIRAGGTLWANPGNINRQSVDLLDHRPAAWILGPTGTLVPEVLPHAADVFDLTGRLVAAASDRVLKAQVESAFVSCCRRRAPRIWRAATDGSIIRDEIEAAFAREATADPVRSIVRSLLDEAVARRGADFHGDIGRSEASGFERRPLAGGQRGGTLRSGARAAICPVADDARSSGHSPSPACGREGLGVGGAGDCGVSSVHLFRGGLAQRIGSSTAALSPDIGGRDARIHHPHLHPPRRKRGEGEMARASGPPRSIAGGGTPSPTLLHEGEGAGRRASEELRGLRELTI
jgi:hypothetical protein